MNLRKGFCSLILLSVGFPFDTMACAQQVETGDRFAWIITHHPSAASFRGLHVVDQNIIWASGSGGNVIRSVDGGTSWDSVGPSDSDALDFRDVYAWSDQAAVITSAGTPARIYRTDDGGTSWTIVHQDDREAAFFDALAFANKDDGLVFSDPVDGRLLLIQSHDGGTSWSEVDRAHQPETLENEAGFAASGTCLCMIDDLTFIGLGGKRGEQQPGMARILKSDSGGETWTAHESGLVSGEASGVFSIAFANRDHGVAVGGNYTQADNSASCASFTSDGGEHWQVPATGPRGYRSCVALRPSASGQIFVCIGPGGSDISSDSGKTWQALDDEGFHAIAFSPNGSLAVATGAGGKIGIWKARE